MSSTKPVLFKSTIHAIIEELDRLSESASGEMADAIRSRKDHYVRALETAPDTVADNILRSHKAICEAKQMGEKEAYGNNPAIYYALGICGEAGELANDVVKALRNGSTADLVPAIRNELADVVIYSYILAHVLDIDLTQLVNEKVEIVIQRAQSGYYGKKLH